MAMAADHVAEGIRVNCVNPGTVETPWVGRLLDKATDPVAERASLEARQPTGRLVTAAEVAAAVLYLGGPRCWLDDRDGTPRRRRDVGAPPPPPAHHRGGEWRNPDLNLTLISDNVVT